jgi:hypothetical protein
MTPEIIAAAYKDTGETTVADIVAGVRKAVGRIETRINDAYERLPTIEARERTKQDCVLLKAQLRFLDHLEGRR